MGKSEKACGIKSGRGLMYAGAGAAGTGAVCTVDGVRVHYLRPNPAGAQAPILRTNRDLATK